MIKSEQGTTEINGSVMDIIADYGVISEGILKSVQDDIRLHVASMLGEMLKLAIENVMKGGEENEKSE